MIPLSLLEFIQITKALKMLYGTQVSAIFFEKNLESVTGLKLTDLNKMVKNSKSFENNLESISGLKF